jgi:hypothetical protein
VAIMNSGFIGVVAACFLIAGCGQNVPSEEKKGTNMGEVVIDLRPSEPKVKAMIEKALVKFAKEKPGIEASCLGLYGLAFPRYVFLSFDTEEHSQRHLEKFKSFGRNFYGKDSLGEFAYSCADFAFPEYAKADFVDFPDFYTCGSNLLFLDLRGQKIKVDVNREGNEGINKVLFPFLKATLASISDFGGIKRAKVFRLGVQMHDSQYVEFWAYGEMKKNYKPFRQWK